MWCPFCAHVERGGGYEGSGKATPKVGKWWGLGEGTHKAGGNEGCE